MPEPAFKLSPPAEPGPEADAAWMREALALAREAFAAGEVPVGAVVVRAGEVLARERNRCEAHKDATAHAELLALQEAQRALGDWRLSECTLYVTKEPCPMCAGAILNTRLGRLVFGLGDPKAGATGGAINVLRLPEINHRTAITSGVLEAESLALVKAFFQQARQQRQAQQ
ncbi:MAG: tRNA adenosine(34) deaminase TadA [Verrucomicrobiota bacterium]